MVSQQGGAWAIGSATVPLDHAAMTLDVTATVQSSDPDQFTEEDPLTVTSHVTAIWTSTLPRDADAGSTDTTVWSAPHGP